MKLEYWNLHKGTSRVKFFLFLKAHYALHILILMSGPYHNNTVWMTVVYYMTPPSFSSMLKSSPVSFIAMGLTGNSKNDMPKSAHSAFLSASPLTFSPRSSVHEPLGSVLSFMESPLSSSHSSVQEEVFQTIDNEAYMSKSSPTLLMAIPEAWREFSSRVNNGYLLSHQLDFCTWNPCTLVSRYLSWLTKSTKSSKSLQ